MGKSWSIAVLLIFVFASGVCHAEENFSKKDKDVVLTPADQLILRAIDKLNDRIDKMGQELNGRIDKMGQELNGRIDHLNGRIDNLWMTMLGGFLGVMAFIGGLVFWDRRTFMSRAREGFRVEMAENRYVLEGVVAALKKLGEEFPQVREALRSFGLL